MRIVLCVPGETFSHRWIACMLNTWDYCLRNGIQFVLSQAQSNNIYYVRNKCLGADVMRGRNQKPFDGKLDYQFILWIDSDSIWSPQQIQRLLNHDIDIVGALQPFAGGEGYTCGWMDEKFFRKHGYMPYLTQEKLKEIELDEKGLLEVDFCGFGLLLVKKGVYEALEYPWHRPIWTEIEIDGKHVQDFSMEDVGFCLQAKRAGFKVFVDPALEIGHEKRAVW